MLTPEQIIENWDIFIENLMDFTEEQPERQKILLDFYNEREEEFATIPASSSVNYHSAFPGGYVFHVNRVVEICRYMYKLWDKYDGTAGFTETELVFAAIHHDLGKVGDLTNILYQQTKEKWQNDKGLYYTYNPDVSYMSIPDRSLYLLQAIGITCTENEWIGIKIHDGLYEDANVAYLKSPSAPRLRNNLPYILHQADMLAARTEYEMFLEYKENLPERTIDASIAAKLKGI